VTRNINRKTNKSEAKLALMILYETKKLTNHKTNKQIKMKTLFFVILVMANVSCSNSDSSNNNNISEDVKEKQEENIYSRDKFEELFYGKPRHFVEKRLGTADINQSLRLINVRWLKYKRKTYLKNSNIPDEWVKLRFDDADQGTVSEIHFE
jgi:hypothetical protein